MSLFLNANKPSKKELQDKQLALITQNGYRSSYIILDSKNTRARQDKISQKIESDYFEALTLNDALKIGPERITAYPQPKGTTAISCSPDGSTFVVSNRAGITRLYSAKDLIIKGMGVTKVPVLSSKVFDGIVACILDDGTISVFMQDVRNPSRNLHAQLKTAENSFKELIPLYEGDNQLGKLISGDANNKFKAIECQTNSGPFSHRLAIGDNQGRVFELTFNIEGFEKREALKNLENTL